MTAIECVIMPYLPTFPTKDVTHIRGSQPGRQQSPIWLSLLVRALVLRCYVIGWPPWKRFQPVWGWAKSALWGRTQHNCFHKYGNNGRMEETPYCIHTLIAEDITNLPPERPVIRLLVVRGLVALYLVAHLQPPWQGQIHRNGCSS